MRLDKYLSTVTDLSRSQAKKAIKEGKVSVEEQVVLDPAANVSSSATVLLENTVLRSATFRYFMMNKPPGYISASKDRNHITVIDLLEEDNRDRLHIAGRLDINTTGLLLITDDGQWSHRVTSPNRDCKKTYYVETHYAIEPTVIDLFKQGMKLDNEKRATKPAELVLSDSHIAQLTISEGKYHQVKRMFAAVGNKVDVLHRQRIGNIRLDDSLMPGQYRALTAEEVASV